ncbi:MAG: GMC family oxidoreductase [Candidatus Nanopelagicales bacterium]
MNGYDADVLVVGSGFGGSVAALRAAQAGRRVIVSEMGRRISASDMQRGAESARALLWEPAVGLHGYFRQRMLRHVTVVGGIGVGGGSLVYAAVLLRPDRATLAAPGWQATGVDWHAELDPHFAGSAAMLQRQVNPFRGIQDEWLQRAAQKLGVAESYGATPQGIDFDACVQCGQCITGCPYGAKQSMDRTYLRDAEDLGVHIRPTTRVEILVPLGEHGDQGWKVVVRNPLAPREVASIVVREVVVAAGVLGTTELLLACRDRWRTMPDLSPRLGDHVRTNSEAFAAILHPPGTDVTQGATISSDFYPDERTHVTNNRFPASYSFMKWYLSPATAGTDQSQRRRRTLAALARHPGAAVANMRARDWHRRSTVLTVMQHADNEMSLRYRRGWGAWRLSSRLPQGADPVPTHLPQADAAGQAVAEVSGGRAYSTILESLLGVGATAHILGGAVIGPDRDSGVVDSEQRVFGYHNLRVMDGSVVPENIGVNPSWTITALAERAAQRWLSGD